MHSVQDSAASIANLAALAGEIALDLETGGTHQDVDWDRLHSLHCAIRALGLDLVNLLSSSNN